jgi:ribosomal protein L11 methyltransferase
VSWGALALEAPEVLEPVLVGCLSPDCLGAEFHAAGPGRGRLTVYFSSPEAAREAETCLRRVLAAHGVEPDACGLRVERIEDGRWVERYQASLQPFPLGEGFSVLPGTEGRGVPGRRAIRLVPGRAFGTGEHPTTRLCVRALERFVERGSLWLDLGCGSAILSLVALGCGARRVLAVDADPEAARVASEVIRENGAQRSIQVVCGRGSCARGGRWDGVVANIVSGYFVSRAGALSSLLRPGGLLIASGFLADTERGAVRGALARAGLQPVDEGTLETWAAIVARRPVSAEG